MYDDNNKNLACLRFYTYTLLFNYSTVKVLMFSFPPVIKVC